MDPARQAGVYALGCVTGSSWARAQGARGQPQQRPQPTPQLQVSWEHTQGPWAEDSYSGRGSWPSHCPEEPARAGVQGASPGSSLAPGAWGARKGLCWRGRPTWLCQPTQERAGCVYAAALVGPEHGGPVPQLPQS